MTSADALTEAQGPSAYQALVNMPDSLFEALPIATCVCAADGNIVRFSRKAAALWGRAPKVGERRERFCASHGVYRLDGSAIGGEETAMAEVLRTGEPVAGREAAVARPDGSAIACAISVEPLKNAAGRVEGALIYFQDMTSRNASESVLPGETVSSNSEPSQRQSRNPLPDSQRLAAIVESSDDAIISKDLNGIIVSWNRSAERLFGYTAEETIGKPITILMPPERVNEEPAILRRIRRGERVDHYETVRRRKDGTLLDISLTISPVKDASGRIVGASKIARDTTERKRLEEQRSLLIAELSHRVKNTLSTVISIARQSFANPDIPEARRSFDSRIRGLAQTHGRLAEANWSGVSLETLLSDELSPYRREDGKNVQTAGPRVVLTARAALTLGMAIHELATNAAKYGALSSKQGNVSVSWCMDYDTLRIEWVESGGPAVQTPLRSGFGRLLIEHALISDLRSDVRLEFAPEGVRCTISVPPQENVAS